MNGTTSAYPASLYAHYSLQTTFSGSTIDHNDLYANVSSGSATSYTGYSGGTAWSTLSNWQSATGVDLNSVSAEPPFTSSSNLLMNAGTTPSVLESAGQTITAYTTDVQGDVRPGPSGSVNGGAIAPDLGADEFDGVPLDIGPPVISYAALATTGSTTNRTFTASIYDLFTGTDTVLHRPRVYYKRCAHANAFNTNDNTTDGWKYTEATGTGGTPFSLVIDYSKLYGGAPLCVVDTIQYFVVAQDRAATPNVAINSGSFSSPPTSIDLTAIQFPLTGSIRQYIILPGICDTVTIGGTAPRWASLKAAFDTIATRILTGPLTILIKGDLTESAQSVLCEMAEEPAGSNYRILLKPVGARTIAYAASGGEAVLKLNGTDNMTIDGLKEGGNSLTISNTTASPTAATAAVWIASKGIGAGCTRDTVRNCVLQTGDFSSTYTTALCVGGAAINTGGADNDNLCVENNTIKKAYFGIFMSGVSGGELDTINIDGNEIGYAADPLQSIGKYGVYALYLNSGRIVRNAIHHLGGTAANAVYDPVGMYLGTNVLNMRVGRNTIHDIIYPGTGGYGGKGIDIQTGNSASGLTIDNNLIYGISGDGWSGWLSDAIVGIRILSGGGINLWYNSVNLYGNISRASATSDVSGALYVASGCTNLDVRNNVFSNSIDNTTGMAKAYAIYCNASNTAFTQINRNDYYTYGVEGILGFMPSSDVWTLAAWRTATGKDGNSIASNPLFNSNTDLLPQSGSPLIDAGEPVAVTEDYLGASRSTTQYVGAYNSTGETTPPTINYSLPGNTASTANRILVDFAVIYDASGVNVTTHKPRLYYKKSYNNDTYMGNTSTDNGWKWVETPDSVSPFDFTIDYSILYNSLGGSGSVSSGDVIQYFVTAQDLAALPNVGIQSGSFSSTPAGTDLTSAAFPITGTINSYTISNEFSGNYNIGLGQTYPTLKAFFDDLNMGVLVGNITGLIKGDCIETAQPVLNQLVESPVGSNFTLTIQPDGGARRTIAYACSSGDEATIKLAGADRVTIDGLRTGGDDLNIAITTSTNNTAAIWLASQGVGAGCSNVTIRNCSLSGPTDTIATSYGIVVGGTSLIAPPGADNDSVTIENDSILYVSRGINAMGTSSGPIDDLHILNNIIGKPASGITNIGVYVSHSNNAVISGNDIGGVPAGSSSVYTQAGIMTMPTCNAITISKNRIHDFIYNGVDGYANWGIYFTCGGMGTSDISNNVIYNIGSDGYYSTSVDNNPAAIYLKTINGPVGIYHNSISLTPLGGTLTHAGSNSACIRIADGIVRELTIKNNVFRNVQTGMGGSSNTYGICNHGASDSCFTQVDHNVYDINGTGAKVVYSGSMQYATLANWIAASALDSNSVSGDPLFTSTTDLTIVTGSGTDTIPPGSDMGETGLPVNDDITGLYRSSTHPDAGAYEFDVSRTISGTGPFTFPHGRVEDVTMTASGDTMVLGGDLYIYGTLALLDGVVSIGAHTIYLYGSIASGGGTLLGGSSSNIKVLGSGEGSSAMPSVTLDNLTLNRSGGLMLTGNVCVDGSLILTNGLMLLGGHTLTLEASATVIGSPSATNMVVAEGSSQMRKKFAGAGMFTFPVGDNTEGADYSPIALNFLAGTFGAGAYAGVSLSDAKHPSNPALDNYLTRYWTVVSNDISSFTCNVFGTYVPDDMTGFGSFMASGKWNGTSWSRYSLVDTVNSRIVATGVTSFSDFSAGDTLMMEGTRLVVRAKVLLQGAWDYVSAMTTYLNATDIPLTQPYGSPWQYAYTWSHAGTESVTAIPSANITDWVLLELRTTTDASSMVERRAAFLKSDGSIVDLDGRSPVSFHTASINSYYLVVYHRNHIAIMSALTQPMSMTTSLYDFSTAQTKAYGYATADPMFDLSGVGTGPYAMIAGDCDPDGYVVYAAEESAAWNDSNAYLSEGYYQTDFDMDGYVVYSSEESIIWNNDGRYTQVP